MRITKRSTAAKMLRRSIGVHDAKAGLSDLESASLEERLSRLVTNGVIEPAPTPHRS